jgi:hypothetical protein
MKPGGFYYGNGMFGFEYGPQREEGEPEDDSKYAHVLCHEGAGSGWRSLWVVVPKEKIGIIILTNYGSINTNLLPENIAYTFIDMCLGFPPFDWTSKYWLSTERTRKFFRSRFEGYVLGPAVKADLLVGEYEDDLYGKVAVVQEKGQLVTVYRGRKIPLTHIGGIVYSFDAHDLTPRYGSDDYGTVAFQSTSGKITELKISLLHEGGGVFKRIHTSR